MPAPTEDLRTYYHACTVNLTLRLDEAFLSAADVPDPVSNRQAARTPASIPLPAASKPLALQAGANPDRVSFVLHRIPIKCSVEKGSVRQAATFEIVIPFRDLPLDPRLIRSCGVEIHMGTVSSVDFARGQNGERRADGSLYSTLATRDDAGRVNRSTLVLVGVVDEAENDEGSKGSTVRLTGRDQRGLLLTSPMPVLALNTLNYDQDIVGVVEELLMRHPMSDRMAVRADVAEWPNREIPGALPQEILPRVRQARARRNRGSNVRESSTRPARTRPPAAHPPGHGANREMSYWDAITRLCFIVGAMPTFINNELWIRPVRGLFEQLAARPSALNRTPFNPDTARAVLGMEPLVIRRLVVGNNLATMKFKRKMGGRGRPHTVRCVSLDLSSRDRTQNRLIEARWPPEAPAVRTGRNNAQAQNVAPSGNRSTEDVLTFPIQGIRSQERLQVIARSLFEEIGRQEISGSFETHNLASFGGGNADPDMLRANPGDAIEVVRDSSSYREGTTSPQGAMADHYNAPYGEMVADYTQRLGDANLARALVATARGRVNEVQRTFRLASLTLDWTQDNGINVSGEVQNYVIVRNSVEGEHPTTPQPITQTVPGR